MKKTLKITLLLALLTTAAFAQLGVGGAAMTTSNPGPPPPNPPCITSGTPPLSCVSGDPYTYTFLAACGTPAYTWSALPNPPVNGLTLNAGTGVLSGTCGTVGTYNSNITVRDANNLTASTPISVQIVSALTITSGAPPNAGTVGVVYPTFNVIASGGSGGNVFSINFGALPNGLSLSTSGVLSGTPTATGTFTFRFNVTDSASHSFNSPTYQIIITNAQPQLINSPPPNGTTGNFYTFSFVPFGGTPGYTCSSTGVLPAGTSLGGTSNCTLSGTLGAPNTYGFRIIVTDSLNQTGFQDYTVIILPIPVGGVNLPIAWVDNHEMDGKTTNTIVFPADGLNMHGGTPYANTQAGVNQAIADANAKRDADGSGTLIKLPHNSPFTGTTAMSLVGSNTTTGLNSKNFIIIDSDTPLTANQTVCSHGVRDNQRNPGCTNDKASMWIWSQTNSANSALSCNASGTQGPAHHYQVKNGEIRDDSTGPTKVNGIALIVCGTNNETAESQQPNHIHFAQDYVHGYDSPEIEAGRAAFYSLHDSSFTYNYFEQIHFDNKESQVLSTQQSARIKIAHNWIEGGSEGIFSGGNPAAIPNYNPSDYEIRGNIVTLDYAWEALSHQGLPAKWNLKNRIELKNMVRALLDGNLLEQSWADGQAGFLFLMNVRACSSQGCTGGNNSTVRDITFTNNILAHAANAMEFDGGSHGDNSCPSGCSGAGQALKGQNWNVSNNLIYDIGDASRYPGQGNSNPFSSFGLQISAGGQTLSCSLTRFNNIATAVCTAQGNVPGTGMSVGDPVKVTASTPDTGFVTGLTGVSATVITGSPTSLTFTYSNPGANTVSASTGTVDNSAGYPNFVTFNHNSFFGANNAGASIALIENNSPTNQYPRNNIFTNNIWATNGGNPGGVWANGTAEGNASLNFWDQTTMQFNCNVLTGRNGSIYSVRQTGQCPNFFPGNGSGGANNQTGIVCPGGATSSSCLGVESLMNGVAYTSNPPDYHFLALRSDSNFAAGKPGQASDGLQQGANIGVIDAAIDATIYTCQTACGTGPFPDAGGVFMVASGGDNVDGCTADKPCDSFTAAQTAMQAQNEGSQIALLHGGTYRLTSNLSFAAADSGDPQEDLVNWWCSNPTFRASNHTTGPGHYNGCYIDADGQKIWEIKSSTGWAADVDSYDNTNVYLWLTENGDVVGCFTDSHCYKRQITPMPLTPRFWSPGPVTAPKTVYRYNLGSNDSYRTTNCETENPPITSLGKSIIKTQGLMSISYGGDFGTLNTILVNYHYGYNGGSGSFNARERFYLTKEYGWSMWDLSSCNSGVCGPESTDGTGPGQYTVTQTSTHSTIAAGAVAAPNWACGTSLPWWFGGTPGVGGNVALPNGVSPPLQAMWRNYPGETATITGNKKVTGLSLLGSCGTNCQEYTATLPSSSWVNFESLWYNGVRRPRPQSVGATPVHGYAPNACPTSAGADAFLCVSGTASGACTGTAQQIANCQCNGGVPTSSSLAGSQTTACTTGWQCFNKYKVNSGDVNASWHGIGVGDVELLVFEKWTMARMRIASVSGGNVTFTGATAQTNDHGCIGGDFYLAENVKEAATKGRWYLDRDVNNDGVLDTNWILHIYADTSIGENPLTADIEVPQLPLANPQVVNGTSVNNLTFTGLTFSGDNFVPDATGLGDQQGQPLVTSALKFTNSNYILFDGITVAGTTGAGLTFQATSTHNTIQNSHFSDIGGLSVRFGTSVSGKMQAQAADTDLNVPQYNTVQNNLFDNPQRVQPSGYGGGVYTGDVHHTLITHNEIINPYTGGIELCFALGRGTDGVTTQQFFCHDNIVSYNLVVGSPNPLMTDFGLFYGAPSYSTMCPSGTPATGNPCNQVVHNVFKNAYSNYDIPQSAATSGGRGIYFDQGSTNVLAQYNLVVRTGHSCIFNNTPQTSGTVNPFLAQNNLYDNNIFAYCGYQNPAFAANLPTAVIAKNGKNGSALTFTHNLSYFNPISSSSHAQNLVGSWPCFADDGSTPTACTNRFKFSNNGWWAVTTGNFLQFATCKTGACSGPYNNTNFNQYTTGTGGQIPAGWTNPWQSNGTAAGEDASSVAVDPVFVKPVYPNDDYHYSHDFSGQGITVFDYTQAGRMPTNTFVAPTVPDMFPIRPLDPVADFGAPGVNPTVTSLSPSQGFAAGGESITVTGTNFISGAVVSFNGSAGTTTFVNSTTLTVIAPSGTSGIVNITVSNPSGGVGTLVSGYQYLATPTTTCTFGPADQTCTLTYVDQYGTETRTTRIILPASRPAHPSLVIYYHGSLVGTGTSECENGGWVSKATAAGFILLCPQGVQINPGAGNNTRSWNAYFNGATYDVGHPPDDSYFNRELAALLYKNASINVKQVFLTGFSSGAHGAYSYSVDAPNVVAAVGVEGGVLLTQPPSPGNLTFPVSTGPVSIIELQGTADASFNYCGRSDANVLQTSVDDLFLYYSGSNGDSCASGSGTNLCTGFLGTPTSSTSRKGTSCNGGSEVRVYQLLGGTHQFYGPGTVFTASGGNATTPSNPELAGSNTVDTLWNFFATHAKP